MIGKIFAPLTLAVSAAEHIIDNAIRDTIDEPCIGSVVYCDLALGYAEHSGIYLGGGEIMHLNSKGWIEKVTPDEFIEGTSALSIYVGCRGRFPVGSSDIANRAIDFEKDISTRDYNVLLDNCHQFTAGCVNGDPENSNNFLWMLKHECENHLSIDSWRVWKDPQKTVVSKNSQSDEKYTRSHLTMIDEKIEEKEMLETELWNEHFPLNERYMKHLENSPGTGIFSSGAKIDAWNDKSNDFEMRIRNITTACNDLGEEIKFLKEKRGVIEAYLENI